MQPRLTHRRAFALVRTLAQLIGRRALVPAIVVAACLADAAACTPPVNDDCVNATPISGNSTFAFDLAGATDSAVFSGCLPFEMEADVWFLWTCTCEGARITTCGLTALDTVIEVYPAAQGCPTVGAQAICCNDDAEYPVGICGYQSSIPFCDMVCGEEYYIRIGVYPSTPTGIGQFDIVCIPANGATICCTQSSAVCAPSEIAEQEPCPTVLAPCQQPIQQIGCGDVVCGRLANAPSFVDEDVYEFTIASYQRVAWSVLSTYQLQLSIFGGTCAAPIVLAVGNDTCPTVAETECLPPGTYWVSVRPDNAVPLFTCDQDNAVYHGHLECVACPSCGVPGSGSCFGVHSGAGCDVAACCGIVCATLPACCLVQWDQACVSKAYAMCESVPCPDPVEIYVCEAGCDDAFSTANGVEPTDPLPALVAISCGTSAPFDGTASDVCVMHTFRDCWPWCLDSTCANPTCGEIVGAALELELTCGAPGGFVDPPDAIFFFDGGTYLWSGDLALLNGGTWANGSTMKLTLNLGALPPDPNNGATDILCSLFDGELGLVVADDTSVDSATLTVAVCPCQTPVAGSVAVETADYPATPSVTTPSADLVAAIAVPGCPVPPLQLGTAGYDVLIFSPVSFLETLLLPTPCVSGHPILKIGLVPFSAGTTGGSMLLLEPAVGCSSSCSAAWEMAISSLASNISPPLGQAPTSTLTLDLAALPPGPNGVTNIMSHLLDGSLDIAIGCSHLGIDFITLDFTTCDLCTSMLCPPGDLDGDCSVSGVDLGVLLSAWGPCGPDACPADLNGDGAVDAADLGLVLAAWEG